MVSHLVLGCGTVGRVVVDAVAGRDVGLSVFEADPERVDTLRNENVAAQRVDLSDDGWVETVESAPQVILVASNDPAANLRTATTAREAFPDATLVAYADAAPPTETTVAVPRERWHVVE